MEKPTKVVPQSTTKFCVVDAFKFMGITGVLDEKSLKACKGGECVFTTGYRQGLYSILCQWERGVQSHCSIYPHHYMLSNL